MRTTLSASLGKILCLLSIACPLVIAAPLRAAADGERTELEQRWHEFQTNTRAFMEKAPVKRDAYGRRLRPASSSLFTATEILTGEYIEKKSRDRVAPQTLRERFCNERGACLSQIIDGRAMAQALVTDFLDPKEFKAKNAVPTASLDAMEAKGLLSAKLDTNPWSDNYWPISKGILGDRYAAKANIDGTWANRFNLVSKPLMTLKAVFNRKQQKGIDNLSPSEKYDLLIGDPSKAPSSLGYLTPLMWKEGERYRDENGNVENWMGICHGWAPASFMLDRPSKAVIVKAADGQTDVKFYPSDIKGLASYLWATTNVPSRILGGRCNQKDPKRDPETNRILDEKCFDTNPGNWHVAIVNQLGIARRSFVLDATYDYEVWNQPVVSYTYRYFNPQAGKEVATLAEATVAKKDFSNDKFKSFRAGSYEYAVGIEMDVNYIVETFPSHSEIDVPDFDVIQSVTYMYDLELNDKKQIIGGEWYSNKHPDFIWMPPYGTRAISIGDREFPREIAWADKEPIPPSWAEKALFALRVRQPLAAIIEELIIRSNRNGPVSTDDIQ